MNCHLKFARLWPRQIAPSDQMIEVLCTMHQSGFRALGSAQGDYGKQREQLALACRNSSPMHCSGRSRTQTITASVTAARDQHGSTRSIRGQSTTAKPRTSGSAQQSRATWNIPRHSGGSLVFRGSSTSARSTRGAFASGCWRNGTSWATSIRPRGSIQRPKIGRKLKDPAQNQKRGKWNPNKA